MNKAILIGRLTNDVEIKTIPNSDTTIVTNKLAIYRDKENTDFIPFVAFNQCAETINSYVKKGDRLGIEGQLQSRKYTTKEGQKRTVIEVFVNRVELIESKPREAKIEKPVGRNDPFSIPIKKVDYDIEPELPF